jgi:Cof subfamily protein (haloacid dehalogenase superfamily)
MWDSYWEEYSNEQKKGIKLVAIDLDGTLLNSQRIITPLTSKIISNVVNREIHIVLVSARMLPSVLNYKKQLNLQDPVIAYSGAVIKPDRSSPIWLGNIVPRIANEIIRFLKSYNIHLFTYIGNIWYVDTFDSEAKEESQVINIVPIIVENVQEIVSDGVTKLTVVGESSTLAEIADYLRQEFPSDITCIFSRPTDLEILKKGISKSKALSLVGKLLNIEPNEMMAIGDHHNDIDMLEFVGTAIAMGNAPKEVKKIADLIAPSNDNDGVAFILDHFF